MQKAIISAVILVASVGAANAQYGGGRSSYGGSSFGSSYGYGTGSNPSGHYVSPSINSHGTFTGGHYRSNPNGTTLDNWSTRGNVNPYTGQVGRRSPGF